MSNKELEKLKNRDEKYNTEMKNTLKSIKCRITEAEERVSELKDRVVEITAMEQNKEKRMKRNEDSLRDLYMSPRRRREKKGPEKIFEEIIAKNFPNMGNETFTQVQEVQDMVYGL